MNTRYFVATTLTIAASLLSACGARVPTQAEIDAGNESVAKFVMEKSIYGCKDGVEYLIYQNGPYTAIAATGARCVMMTRPIAKPIH